MSKTLLILGNGFDLDLKLKTGYKDFTDSIFWPFDREDSQSPLARFLYEQFQDGWYDLEDALGKYFSKDILLGLSSDQMEFFGISVALTGYLNEIQKAPLKEYSYAATVLHSVCEVGCEGKIYSFYYTDLESFAERLNVKGECKVSYVHGSLKDNNIILGVGDYVQLPHNNEFAYKTSNPKYKSSYIARDLAEYDNVIFFGHSISQIDYPYFKRFFKQIAEGTLQNKYVRFLTYDDSSRASIISNIRAMERDIVSITSSCDFDIIQTHDHGDFKKFKEMIHHINPNMRLMAFSVTTPK